MVGDPVGLAVLVLLAAIVVWLPFSIRRARIEANKPRDMMPVIESAAARMRASNRRANSGLFGRIPNGDLSVKVEVPRGQGTEEGLRCG